MINGMTRFFPYVGRVGGLAAVYFAAARLGLSLAVIHQNVSLVWPPTGIALAAILFFGYRVWPGVALGAFLINAATGVGVATAGGIAVGNTLEALVGAYLLHRFARFQNSLERLQDVLGLVAFSALGSTTVSATIGVTSLCLGGAAPWALYGSLWWQWWLGDAMGALVVAPVLLTWGTRPRISWQPWQAAEAGALLVLLVAIGQIVFGGWFTTKITNYPWAFAIFPFVMWAALRFGQREAATATLAVSAMAIWGTVRDFGPFLGATLTESLMLFQTFMSVVAVTALVLGAVITQRRRGEERFRRATEAAPNAMIMVDAQGTIRLVNAQAEKFLGYTREELLGLGIDRLVPERFRGRHAEYRATFFASPQTRPMGAGRDLFVLRKDGSEVPVEIGLNSIETDAGTFVLAAIIDITERRRAQEALELANQNLTGWVMELELRTRQITVLSEMGDLLQSCRTPEEAHGIIAEFAPKLFPAGAGLLGVLNASKNFVEVVAAWGDSPPGERLFAPDRCWALRRGRAHLVKGPTSGAQCEHLDAPLPTGYLCVPMMAQGEPLGVLHLRQGPSEPLGIESQQQLAVSMAEHIALALANLRLQESLRAQAIRDPLTGLFNRRYMEESLDREVRRSQRSKLPIGIVMLDIDHFKAINDTSGHDAGDALLRELGVLLKGAIRDEDIACRFGGEEFILILPEADVELTRRRAEQLREEIKRLRVSSLGQVIGPVTASLGVAAFPQHGTTGATLLQAADAALYRAKNEGRDRVITAG